MNPADTLRDEFGQFADLVEVRIKLERIGPGLGKGAVLILPPSVLAGATAAYGLPIVRADVQEPMLGLPGERT